MLTAEEAAAEMAAEESAGLRNEAGNKVISRLPSFHANAFKRVNTRQPSFFQKMFSMRQLDAALNGEDDEEEGDKKDKVEGEDGEEKKDQADGAAEGDTSAKKSAQEADSAKQDEEVKHADPHSPANAQKDHHHEDPLDDDEEDDDFEGGGGSRSTKLKNYAIDAQGQRIVYPPILKVGQPIYVERMVNRNRHAHIGMEALMDMVDRDVRQAIQHAKSVPVHPEVDRVQVTSALSGYIANVRSRRGVEKRFSNNMSEIQKALTYRKSSIIMMNSNYSNQLVRKIEPIYVQEARSIVKPT